MPLMLMMLLLPVVDADADAASGATPTATLPDPRCRRHSSSALATWARRAALARRQAASSSCGSAHRKAVDDSILRGFCARVTEGCGFFYSHVHARGLCARPSV